MTDDCGLTVSTAVGLAFVTAALVMKLDSSAIPSLTAVDETLCPLEASKLRVGKPEIVQDAELEFVSTTAKAHCPPPKSWLSVDADVVAA